MTRQSCAMVRLDQCTMCAAQCDCYSVKLSKAPFTRYNLLSNRLPKNLLSIRLSNRIDNRLYRVYKHLTGACCIVYTAGYQTGCTTRFDNRLNEQWLFVQHGCQAGCITGLTTGLNRFHNRLDVCLVYAIQPVPV